MHACCADTPAAAAAPDAGFETSRPWWFYLAYAAACFYHLAIRRCRP